MKIGVLSLALLALQACNSANPDNLGIVNQPAPPAPVAQIPVQQPTAPTLDANGNVITPNGGQISTPQGVNAVAPQNLAALPQAETVAPQTQIPPTSVHIAPIIGATVNTVKPLSSQIQAIARSNNIGIQSSPASAQYTLRGYFSALAENGQTTVIYVWDVIDRSGNRLHRISGQEKRPGGRPDAWSGVTPDMMQNVANKTMTNFQNWRLKRNG